MEASNGIIGSGLLGFLALVPGLLVSLVGLILSFAYLGRMPRAAVAGIVAYGGMLLLCLFGPIVNVFLMASLARTLPISGPGLSCVLVQGLVGLAFALLAAVASGILVYGYFFADRKKSGEGAA